MYKFLFVIGFFLLNANMVFAQNTEESSHTVIKGDTLWDLAGRYYNDPWGWSRIWEANKLKITNPHWIYPNQTFVIPGKSAPVRAEVPVPEPEPVDEIAQVEQETIEPQEEFLPEELMQEEVFAEPEEYEEEVVEEEVELPVLTKTEKEAKKYLSAESFVVDSDWKVDGHIAGEKEKKLLIATGDTVYLNLGSDKLQPGHKCIVYRKVGKVRDRKTHRFLGYEVRRIGKLEVMDKVSSSAASAKVTTSYEPLRIGDLVKISE